MKYRGIFEYEYPTKHKPPVSIDVHLHGDCVKGKIIEWEYRPLEQEPRKGHWISRPHIYGVTFCSECGFELKINNTNYCPNCGCCMIEPQESENV